MPKSPRKSPRLTFEVDEERTYFRNVDVDVWSKSDLQPLLDAFGKKILVAYVGKIRTKYWTHFSLAITSDKDADARLRLLVKAVNGLPAPARLLWNGATQRDFNIGLQVGIKPYSHELAIKADTVRLVAEVNARIVFTTYAPPLPTKKGRGSGAIARGRRK